MYPTNKYCVSKVWYMLFLCSTELHCWTKTIQNTCKQSCCQKYSLEHQMWINPPLKIVPKKNVLFSSVCICLLKTTVKIYVFIKNLAVARILKIMRLWVKVSQLPPTTSKKMIIWIFNCELLNYIYCKFYMNWLVLSKNFAWKSTTSYKLNATNQSLTKITVSIFPVISSRLHSSFLETS